MTIPTSASAITVAGNALTTAFNFSFVGDAVSDIYVSYINATGNMTPLNPSQYSITLNPAATNQLWGIGGVITYPLTGSPIPAGTYLSIQRILPLTQQVSIQNQGNVYPRVTEQALDILEMQIQQVSARTGQARGIWGTGIVYNYGDIVIDGVNGNNTGSYYLCAIPNTSTVWATDLAAGDWALSFDTSSLIALVAQAQASAASAANSATASATSATNSSGSATDSANSATASANSATTATTQAGIATTQATNASNSAIDAANFAAGLLGTSTTSNTIGSGSLSFTTQTGKQFAAGQFIIISDSGNSSNYVHGNVTSYNSGTGALVINVTDIGGSGTKASWNISVSGSQGTPGTAAFLTQNHIFVGNATNQATDIAMSGDATILASGALTISNSAVTNAKMANMATLTIKSNITGVPAAPSDNTVSSVGTLVLALPAVTKAAGDNSTSVATTAYADRMLKAPVIKITQSTAISTAANNAATALTTQMDTKVIDTNNAFSTTTGRFTPQVAGYYRVRSIIESVAASGSLSIVEAHIYFNGADEIASFPAFISGQAAGFASVDDIILFNGTTDYAQLGYRVVYSGGISNIQSCSFIANMVRPS